MFTAQLWLAVSLRISSEYSFDRDKILCKSFPTIVEDSVKTLRFEKID